MIAADLRAAFARRYGNRPDTLADVIATAEAWERLKETGAVPSMYARGQGFDIH